MILVNSHLETRSPDGGNMILYRKTTATDTRYLFEMGDTALSVLVSLDLTFMSVLQLKLLSRKFMKDFSKVSIDDTNLLSIFRSGNTVIEEVIRRLEE